MGTRKIAMLIAAFDDEQAQLHGTVEKLARSAVLLEHEVRNAAREAVEAALKELYPHVHKAGQKTKAHHCRTNRLRNLAPVRVISYGLVATMWNVHGRRQRLPDRYGLALDDAIPSHLDQFPRVRCHCALGAESPSISTGGYHAL